MEDVALEVVATQRAGHEVLAVAGELDLVAAPVLQAAVDGVMHDGHSSLVLDLSGVRFLDSAGLRVLVWAHRVFNDGGGQLRIACSTDRVRQVFRIANLDGLFAIYSDLDSALAEE